MKLKCYVVDDEMFIAQQIVNLISDHPDLLLVGFDTDEERAFHAISKGKIVTDVLFLDIMMPEINGFQFAAGVSDKTRIVMVTADKGMAVHAYDQHVLDYLSKPVTRERFQACVDKLKQWFHGKFIDEDQIMIQIDKGKFEQVRLRDITFMESISNYVSVHFADGNRLLTYISLSALESKLNASFLRVHKSFIVNIDHIKRVSGSDLEMPHGHFIRIGPKYHKVFMQIVMKKKF